MPLSVADHAGVFLNRCSLTRILLPNLAVQGNWKLVNMQQRRSVELTNFSRRNVFSNADNIFLVAGGAL